MSNTAVMSVETTTATTAQDRRAVFAFRYDLYCRQQRMFLDVADHELGELHDHDDHAATLLIARDGDCVIGTLRANWGSNGAFSDELSEHLLLDRFIESTDPKGLVVLSRFLVAVDHRGGSVSTLLILEAAKICLERGIEVIICDCEPHLLDYYRRLGFRPYGTLFSDPTSLLVPLVLFVGDRAHLRAVDSPALGLVPEDHCPPPSDAQLSILANASANSYGRSGGQASIEELLERVGGAPSLLEGLSDDEIDWLTGDSFVLQFREGDVLFGEGTTTRTLYCILEGIVEITIGGRIIAMATRGTVIGELAMLLDRGRTATARAATDGRALSISDRSMIQLAERHPQLGVKVLWNLSCILAHKLGEADSSTV